MPPHQYVQKPYKVIGEQYAAAADPPVPGICHCTFVPMFPNGETHVHLGDGVVAPTDGDWIVQDVWQPYAWHVIPPGEFSDRFGGPPAEEPA